MQDNNQADSTRSPTHKESFVRWQAITITQFGYSIGLVLTFTTASLGFAFALVKDKDFVPGGWGKLLFVGALVVLIFSTLCGIACVVNRLCDFRKTKDIARDREKWEREGELETKIDSKLEPRREECNRIGERTWLFFYWQAGLFAVGILLLIAGLATIYAAKLL